MKRIIGVIKAIYFILKNRNFILIHGIEEFEQNGEPGRRLAYLRRTDYNTESDFYSMKASMVMQFGSQIMDDHARIGDYEPKVTLKS